MSSIPAYPTVWQHGGYDRTPATETLHQRVSQISAALTPPCWQALADIAMRPLRAQGPFVPASADDERMAQWLASPAVGLLEPVLAGYVTTYRLTYLGVAVIQAFLTDALDGRGVAAIPTLPLPPQQIIALNGQPPRRRDTNRR